MAVFFNTLGINARMAGFLRPFLLSFGVVLVSAAFSFAHAAEVNQIIDKMVESGEDLPGLLSAA